MSKKTWKSELVKGRMQINYAVSKQLFAEKSPYQQVEVYQSEGYGRILFNDDLVMVTEADEHIYHEMITHPAMAVYPDIKNALIIGGGDGGTARELAKYSSVDHIDNVEIDDAVVRACKEFIPQTACGFDHPKVKLYIEDGIKFVKNPPRSYDLIIVDSSDPIGPATPLFNLEFYRDLKNCLTSEGIIISQAESPYYNENMQAKILTILSELFPICSLYNYANLSYPGGFWSFSWASSQWHPTKTIQNLPPQIQDGLKYYTPELHRGAFALPRFQQENLKDWIST